MSFHPAIARWFAQKFGTPTAPQELGWPAIQSGAHTLIAAPTGSGKTLAAFLAELDALYRAGLAGTLAAETRVLYVSPLKALSNDIHKNLEEPLVEIGAALPVEIRAAVRTGDTPPAKRQAIAKTPPHILVTTPESFYLMLTSVSGRKTLRTVRTLIVDEIHAVVANRRGSHLALSMERLAALVDHPLQRIGLSATQKPIAEVAKFLTAGAPCQIIDTGHKRALDLALELPGSALEAVMSNEVWTEIYQRLVNLIEAHRTTLVFVNTRRLAERVSAQLGDRLGHNQVAAHHGSLSAKLRLDAEHRLKHGELKALVATASLELGIDIGAVDLVCQIGTTRSIATFLQRVGRAAHTRYGLPKGRLFPLTRDELVECTALLECVARGELDALHIPQKPLDVLAQQIVAAVACEDWPEDKLFDLFRRAYPYRQLSRAEFDAVVRMLAQGFSTKRGRRAALIHHDGINHRLRGRRGSRLIALTSGGAIPDNSDYRVVVEPSETFIGTVNEDFAVESMAGDIFQLGNASWKILGINAGHVRVADAHGQPPGIPFWLGEGPARTAELSHAVSELRERGAAHPQVQEYFAAARRILGVMPTQDRLVMERFFDESGGMQLVIHSLFGARLNRAWGLALRKRFCRSFNFELQAAATDDAIVLSLGTQHSFPLDEVFRYLTSHNVREILVQALLDAPMFGIRWRWNATRALALPRQRGGRKLPAPIQRMESENLLAAVFPDQLACLENIAGDREIPDHPLVQQTIDDCLTEAMDIAGLEALLRRIETGQIECIARDLPEPSPLAHEILNAKPYAFLDDAPLEERRTQAVYTRRASEPTELGILDAAAIEKVCAEAWPQPVNADEMHDALMLAGALRADEVQFIEELRQQNRVVRVNEFWVAAERANIFDEPQELVRGRLEIAGPVTARWLADFFHIKVDAALLALEAEGFVLRGKFHPGATELEWCDRRLLARIHRLTLNRLRAEIQPVALADFQRFLLAWQKVDAEHRVSGPAGTQAVLEMLDGYEVPAAAWEPAVLAGRVKEYTPDWLDRLCFTGKTGWGRLSPPQQIKARSFAPLRSSPIAVFDRDNLRHWLALSETTAPAFAPDTALVLQTLTEAGALFFGEIVQRSRLLPSRVEESLGDLVTHGFVTADSFEGLRALLIPAEKRVNRRHHRAVTSVAAAGRWSLLRGPVAEREAAIEAFARGLLRRYGVMFRRLLERESLRASWFELTRTYRRLEARGAIRGGHFVAGVSGEQFALPEAIGRMRSVRQSPANGETIILSAADPLNLAGVLTPGPRIPALTGNRILVRDGVPLAVIEAGKLVSFNGALEPASERALSVGKLPAALRPYYA